MPDILQELALEATPQRVFSAITQQDELARWWTHHVTAEPKVGSIAEFRFEHGTVVFKMEITALDTGKSVHWAVRHGPPNWDNTTVTWDLEPCENGTKLHFGHHSFVEVDAGYEQTRAGWEYYLGSLKSYLETGKGTPNE